MLQYTSTTPGFGKSLVLASPPRRATRSQQTPRQSERDAPLHLRGILDAVKAEPVHPGQPGTPVRPRHARPDDRPAATVVERQLCVDFRSEAQVADRAHADP